MENTYESCGQRYVKSCCCMCIGFIMIPLTISFIFWTENEAVVSYATAKVVWTATELEECQTRAEDVGKLVLAPCDVFTPDIAPKLPSPMSSFLPAFNGSKLEWGTEIYQYRENSHKECTKDNKGGEHCHTEYTCSLEWSKFYIDSSGFKCDDAPSNIGHDFPAGLQQSGSIVAPAYSVVLSHDGTNTGGLALDNNLQGQLPSAQLPFKRPAGQRETYQRRAGVLSPNMLQLDGRYLVTYWSQPQVGDIRIQLTGNSATTATVAAKQGSSKTQANSYKLKAWPPQSFDLFGKQTKPLEKLFPGRLSADEFVEAWNNEITGNLWLRRIAALVLLIIAFESILQPLSVAADLLRMLNWCTCGCGSILDEAAQCLIHTLAITAAFVLCLFTVALAWIVARPVLGCFLLLVAGTLLFLGRRAAKKQSARVAMADASTGLMSSEIVLTSATPAPMPTAMATAVPVAVATPVQQSMQVTCPAGVRPGQVLQIQGPDGRMLNVEVPSGVQPGQAFSVAVAP